MSSEMHRGYRDNLGSAYEKSDSVMVALVNANHLISSAQTAYKRGERFDHGTTLKLIYELLNTAHQEATNSNRQDLIAKIQLTALFIEHMINPSAVVEDKISLDGLYGSIGSIARPLLQAYDEITPVAAANNPELSTYKGRLKGQLQEVCYFMISSRNQSRYRFCIPATMYEDGIESSTRMHFDGSQFRVHRGNLERRKVQIKSSSTEYKKYHADIAVIHGSDMHNTSGAWWDPKEEFGTVRAMLDEIDGKASSEQIIHIQKVAAHINKKVTAVPCIKTPISVR